MRTVRPLVLLALLVLAGCSSGDPVATPTSPPAPTVEAPMPTLEPSPVPVVLGATFRIVCSNADFSEQTEYATPDEAWAVPSTSCDGLDVAGTPSPREQNALSVAYGKAGDLDSLGTLYSICAELGAESSFRLLSDDATPEQVSEVKGALSLCPKHPDAARVKKALGVAEQNNTLRAGGRIFGPGVFRVGPEIKPGTYFVTDVEGCYWERTDANGDIIDNNFTNGAARVQVTIRASDFSFNSSRCGEWHPVR